MDQLEPKLVFHYFEEICKIPHGSYHCQRLSDYCVTFAKERGLVVHQDSYDNVVIKKEASSSCAKKKPLILQGHLDMVWQKNKDVSIDLSKDPLNLAIDGDMIYAKGTTLGGDDGIAIAYCLALLDDDTIEHPPLEVVFTTEEEVGMEGANGFDASILSGRSMINIDSEDEGILLVACAGGSTVKVVLPFITKQEDMDIFTLSITGLQGGHSGTEIHRGLANGHKLMGQLLAQISDVAIINLSGSPEQKDNAIPYESMAKIGITDENKLLPILDQMRAQWKKEYGEVEPNLSLSVHHEGKQKVSCLTKESQEDVLTFLNECPQGVCTMSEEMDGLVESSLNLGILTQEEGEMEFSFGVRSSKASKKEDIIHELKHLTKACHGTMIRSNDYPAWEYQKDSPLRDTFIGVYKDLYGKMPKIESIHAGLECGIFASKISGLDIVAFGPDILDIHTSNERMSISSVQRTWEYLVKIIEEFP